jgi:ABC-type dipeptide/oligopeptide/nickel transport system permease subunit
VRLDRLAVPNFVFLVLVVLSVVAAAAPGTITRVPAGHDESFVPPSWYEHPPDGEWYILGTDYLGRPFTPVLFEATGRTARIALLGTAAVVLGCLSVGVVHGATGSRTVEALIGAGNLGLMAVPEAAVFVAIAAAWPRAAPPLSVNASMIAVLVVFAIPAGARLIAERVRAVGRTGFVAASRAYGASFAHTFWHDIRPHLVEDLAWIVASVLPRFVAVEIGLAYLGVEYREFEGLGRVLAKSFSNLSSGTAEFQLLATVVVVVWVALLPQVVLRWCGARPRAEGAP